MIKNMIRVILFVVGILGLVWFLLPLFKYGVLNIGNATGIIIFLLVIVYGLKMQRINNWIIKVWETTRGKIVLIVVAAIVVVALAMVLIITSCMIKAANKPVSQNPTVIVLGCKVIGEKPSLSLLERLEAAYAYLSEHTETKCILSGGKGWDEGISEAECMYRYLVDKGIDPERLYKEDQSTSTRENLAYSKEIIEQYDLNQELAIVTNEFHEYRAGKIADSLGLEFGAVSSKTAWWLFPTYYVRELYGIVYQWVF